MVQVVSPEALDARRFDVYRLGVILLEMTVGHAIDISREISQEDLVSLMNSSGEVRHASFGHNLKINGSSEMSFSGLLYLLQNMTQLLGKDPESLEKAKVLLQISMWCVEGPESRPTMPQIVQALEGNLPIPEKFSDIF
jgi:hypothetical protein